jgi:hypothetical protein
MKLHEPKTETKQGWKKGQTKGNKKSKQKGGKEINTKPEKQKETDKKKKPWQKVNKIEETEDQGFDK